MKYIQLFPGEDGKSHFKEMDAGFEQKLPLGNYSKKHPVKDMIFRDFEPGAVFDWHPAPQSQYIIYLEGEVEVEASDGEIRLFKAGDVLFATDLTGMGHVTRTLTRGRSIIVTANDSNSEECNYKIKS